MASRDRHPDRMSLLLCPYPTAAHGLNDALMHNPTISTSWVWEVHRGQGSRSQAMPLRKLRMNGKEEDRVTLMVTLELIGRCQGELPQPYALTNLSMIH